METDWVDLVQTRLTFSPRVTSIPSSTALAFDSYHGLVWSGDETGRLSSFIVKMNLQKYSSFKIQPFPSGSIRHIITCPDGVLSLSNKSICFHSRGGLPIWSNSSNQFMDLRCAILIKQTIGHNTTPALYVDEDDSTHVLVAGYQNTMFRISLRDGSVIETIPAFGHYSLFRMGGRYICAATEAGTVHILDSRTLSLAREWNPPSDWINDMDANSEYLVLCGYSIRSGQSVIFDPLAHVFDLRQLVPLSPIPFQIGASFIRMHPRMSTTGILVSKSGHMQTIDVMNPLSIMVRHSPMFETQILSLDLSPSGEALSFADDNGTLHLWASPAKVGYVDFGPVDYPTTNVSPQLDWDVSLNSIPLPYYFDVLASAWPTDLLHHVGAPPAIIDPDILMHLQPSDVGFWAPNPQKTLRNQVQNTRQVDSGPVPAPRFLSEQARDPDKNEQASLDLSDLSLVPSSGSGSVPIIYQNVEIKYSRFGVDDFDFRFFNTTVFSGLETHIPNSYANSLLQLYRFTPIIRNFALQHTATSCIRPDCLLCELGFLVDMMEKATGINCQATNFLKVFSGLPHVGTLGLLEDIGHPAPPSSMIQSLNKFLSDKVATDYRTFSNTNAMDKALYSNSTLRIRCMTCNNEVRKTDTMSAHDLLYPLKAKNANYQATFSQVLMTSLEKKDNSRGWCNDCHRYQQVSNREIVRSLPAVLLFNTAITSPDAKRLWVTPNWLPHEIGISFEHGKLICHQGSDLTSNIEKRGFDIIVYELVGLVAEIHNDACRKDHLVSLINVGISSPNPDAPNEWHLFNDFLVQKIPKRDALKFDATWKLPVALSFQIKSQSHFLDNSWKSSLDLSILLDPGSIPPKSTIARPLGVSERPYSGMTVSMDSEFVCVEDEEFTIRSGGNRETVRPSRLALGRLSVLRGAGPSSCDPFIDDYVAVLEPVKDHLTAYSGISAGDLDWATSPHKLVTLKAAYKKLWLLLNMGCIFVGHGLLKDFRIINIHVPRSQVVDTVDLFFLKHWGGRKLSLRFLAWLLLEEEIQTGMHDSIEDARTAYCLWQRYQEYVDDGSLDDQLEWVYTRGRELGWKAPSTSSPSNKSDSPAQKRSGLVRIEEVRSSGNSTSPPLIKKTV